MVFVIKIKGAITFINKHHLLYESLNPFDLNCLWNQWELGSLRSWIFDFQFSIFYCLLPTFLIGFNWHWIQLFSRWYISNFCYFYSSDVFHTQSMLACLGLKELSSIWRAFYALNMTTIMWATSSYRITLLL